jgi:hypothetical protein
MNRAIDLSHMVLGLCHSQEESSARNKAFSFFFCLAQGAELHSWYKCNESMAKECRRLTIGQYFCQVGSTSRVPPFERPNCLQLDSCRSAVAAPVCRFNCHMNVKYGNEYAVRDLTTNDYVRMHVCTRSDIRVGKGLREGSMVNETGAAALRDY